MTNRIRSQELEAQSLKHSKLIVVNLIRCVKQDTWQEHGMKDCTQHTVHNMER